MIASLLVKPCSISTDVFQQGAVILSARKGVDGGPTVLTKVLKTCHTATEKRSRFPIALHTMTFITHLPIHNIWFELNLHVCTCMYVKQRWLLDGCTGNASECMSCFIYEPCMTLGAFQNHAPSIKFCPSVLIYLA